MARCKDDKIKVLFLPKEADEKNAKNKKAPVRTKTSQSPQRSRELTPKKGITPQKTREGTPKKGVHPAAVYQSLSIDHEPEDRMLKFKEELERHIKASTTTLSCRSAENCLINLRKTISLEVSKAYELMHSQLNKKLTNNLFQLYENMGSKLIGALNSQCEKNGLAIPQIPYTLPHLEIVFPARRGLPKLKQINHLKVYDCLGKIAGTSNNRSFVGDDLQTELYAQIDREIERLALKLDSISSQQIQEDRKSVV